MRETIKLGSFLFIICAVAGLALAATNYFTRGKIEENKLNAEKNALKEVLSSASIFEAKTDYTEGFDEKNNSVGYVLKVKTAGYSSQIEALVGVDREFKIKDVKILSQSETPGLGTKITEKKFLNQFIGKPTERIQLKKDGGEIDCITSATISSRAITDAIRKEIDEFQKTHE